MSVLFYSGFIYIYFFFKAYRSTGIGRTCERLDDGRLC